jgi:hypothetical protein
MTDTPVEVPRLRGSGPRGAVTAADLAAARQVTTGGIRPGSRPPFSPVLTAYPFAGRGPAFEIDKYSVNPLYDFVKQLPGGAPAGNPPQMFFAGDLPLLTASGVGPELLRWVPWWFRNSAATTRDVGIIYAMLEGGDPDDNTLQNQPGANAWTDYKSAVIAWVLKPPASNVMTEAEFEEWSIGIGWQSPTAGAPTP